MIRSIITAITAITVGVLCLFGSGANAMLLANNGRTDYIIVVADKVAEPEQTAASELQHYLREVTGATLHVCRESEVAADVPQILVGQSARAKSLMPGFDWPSLEQDGIVMKTVGKHLILAGGQPRGTIYSVYTFLEDIVGCCWWTATESSIPKRDELAIGALNTKYVPPLRYRDTYYRDIACNPLFAVKMKQNGDNPTLPEKYGGNCKFLGWVHTFYKLLPPEKYFAQHPDWYSEINGKREYPLIAGSRPNAQLCLTNEEMRKELTRVALEWIKADPSAGIISVSQNDCQMRCECAKCKAVEQIEGSPAGTLIHFVNAVAEDIEKQYPNVLVETLAYEYTIKPPLHIKPRHNVLIRLCTDGNDYAQPIESEANRKFQEYARGWSRISPKIFIWDYRANFSNSMIPNPNLHTLAPNLRFFLKNNAVGVFAEGPATSVTYGDFLQLHAWLTSHMLWDPSRDINKLIEDFLQGYYGRASSHLSKYLDLIHAALKRSGLASKMGNMYILTSFMELEDLNEATRLFDAAERAAAGDDEVLKRVRRERMSLDLMWLLNSNRMKSRAERQGLPFLGPKDSVAALKSFGAAGREFDVRGIGDSGTFESYLVSLERWIRPIAPLDPESMRLATGDWEDMQDGMFDVANIVNFGEWVDDPLASDGRAARIPGKKSGWAIKIPIYGHLVGKWHCYAVARCEAKASEGTAFFLGLCDKETGSMLDTTTVTIEQLRDGKYHPCDLGVRDLRSTMLFYLLPPVDEDAVSAIYIDRMFFVPVK